MPQTKDEKDDQELTQIAALVERYTTKAKSKLDAGTRIADVENAVRIGKLACVEEHFGD